MIEAVETAAGILEQVEALVKIGNDLDPHDKAAFEEWLMALEPRVSKLRTDLYDLKVAARRAGCAKALEPDRYEDETGMQDPRRLRGVAMLQDIAAVR